MQRRQYYSHPPDPRAPLALVHYLKLASKTTRRQTATSMASDALPVHSSSAAKVYRAIRVQLLRAHLSVRTAFGQGTLVVGRLKHRQLSHLANITNNAAKLG